MSEPLFSDSFLARTLRRRSFFRAVGATVATSTLVLAGCNDNSNPTPTTTASSLNLGANDNGVLNYAYLLEQIEAAFYQKVVDAFPTDFTTADKEAFVDLRDHEVIHREFLRYALSSNAYDANLTTPLVFDFSSFTLTTRAGVYAAARTLEDVGVAAYNGAGKLITDANTLRLLGKIASVEARHAAFVRDQIEPNSFAAADVVTDTGDAAGLDKVLTPTAVVELIAKFVPATIIATGLPIA